MLDPKNILVSNKDYAKPSIKDYILTKNGDSFKDECESLLSEFKKKYNSSIMTGTYSTVPTLPPNSFSGFSGTSGYSFPASMSTTVTLPKFNVIEETEVTDQLKINNFFGKETGLPENAKLLIRNIVLDLQFGKANLSGGMDFDLFQKLSNDMSEGLLDAKLSITSLNGYIELNVIGIMLD